MNNLMIKEQLKSQQEFHCLEQFMDDSMIKNTDHENSLMQSEDQKNERKENYSGFIKNIMSGHSTAFK